MNPNIYIYEYIYIYMNLIDNIIYKNVMWVLRYEILVSLIQITFYLIIVMIIIIIVVEYVVIIICCCNSCYNKSYCNNNKL